jgi:hypothetical protein
MNSCSRIASGGIDQLIDVPQGLFVNDAQKAFVLDMFSNSENLAIYIPLRFMCSLRPTESAWNRYVGNGFKKSEERLES